ADVEALPTHRVVHVRGVARKQHASLPVGRRLPGHVREPGDPGWAVHPKVRSPYGDERLAEITQGRLTSLPGGPFADDAPYPPPSLGPAQALLALLITADAQLRLLAHLDLRDQRADRRIPAGELDASSLADQAATAVAPDEVFRPQRLAVFDLDL